MRYLLEKNDIDTVKYYTKDKDVPTVPLAYNTLVILSKLYGGLHNMPYGELEKFPYLETFCIEYYYKGCLATYDFSHLTTLVFLAHEMAIRVEIQPTKKNGIKILFHERSHKKDHEDLMWHPTLDQAVRQF